MVILAFAIGTQLFVEPQLISEASLGVAGRDYSLEPARLRLRVPEQQRQLRRGDLRRAPRDLPGGGRRVRDPIEILRCRLTPPRPPRPRPRSGRPAPPAAHPRHPAAPLARYSPAAAARLRRLLRPAGHLAAAGRHEDGRAARPGQPALLRVMARTAAELGRADRLPGRRDPAVAAQLGAVRVPRPGDHPGPGIPAGYALAMTEFRGRRALLVTHAGGHAHAGHDPGRAAVPRDQRGAPDRVTVVGGAAVLVLPVRRLPDLHLLQHRAAPRFARRGPHRRLHGVRGLPPDRAAAGRARSSRWWGSSASWRTGPTTSCPT